MEPKFIWLLNKKKIVTFPVLHKSLSALKSTTNINVNKTESVSHSIFQLRPNLFQVTKIEFLPNHPFSGNYLAGKELERAIFCSCFGKGQAGLNLFFLMREEKV